MRLAPAAPRPDELFFVHRGQLTIELRRSTRRSEPRQSSANLFREELSIDQCTRRGFRDPFSSSRSIGTVDTGDAGGDLTSVGDPSI